MLFRRREKLSFWGKARAIFWPKRSFVRSLRYLGKRVLRLRATPHAVAAGFAAGIFASFTPFIGFHFLMAFAIAYCIAGNMAAAALGCTVGNPLTFPAIWGSTYEVGRYLLASEAIDGQAPVGIAHALAHMDVAAIWTPFLKPMLVGSVPIGLAFGIVGYGIVFLAVRSFQRRRTRDRALRASERVAHAAAVLAPAGTGARKAP